VLIFVIYFVLDSVPKLLDTPSDFWGKLFSPSGTKEVKSSAKCIPEQLKSVAEIQEHRFMAV
jgi:hypothetical protein